MASQTTTTIGPELVTKVQGYLQAKSHHDDPSASQYVAWGNFYEVCDPLLSRFAGRYGVRGSDLDDCVQNTWVRLLRHLPTFPFDPKRGAFCTWLYRLAHSATMDYLRRRQKNRAASIDNVQNTTSAAGYEDPAEPILASEAKEAVDRILRQASQHLSPKNYQLMVYRWVEERSVQETADLLGITHKQVWYREHRLKKKLQDILKGGTCAEGDEERKAA